MASQTPVRWQRDADVPEYRCPSCLEWLPLTIEYWLPGQGMTRCRTCKREYQRAWIAIRRRERPEDTSMNYVIQRLKLEGDPEALARHRARNRERMRRWRAGRRHSPRPDPAIFDEMITRRDE